MEPNYSPCLDRFIEISEKLSEGDNLEAQREDYSLSSRALELHMPGDVDFFDEKVQTREHSVVTRRYELRGSSPEPLIVYFHGGGWVKGDLNSHHEVVARMAAATKAAILAVHYPLAPENRHPAQLLSGYAVLQYVAAKRGNGAGGPLLVAGDSAGGQIAASLCMLARQEAGPAIAGQVLIYPALDHRCDSDSFDRHADGPILTAESMKAYWQALIPPGGDTAHFLSPLLEHDLVGLPPAIIQLAENDVLHDEGVAYGVRMKKDGVPVEVLDGAGMVHGFVRAIGLSEGARAEFERLCASVASLIERVSS
jgi:acetyl esterase